LIHSSRSRAGVGAACSIVLETAWTADYLKITGELDVDLRSISPRSSGENCLRTANQTSCDDPGTEDALQFLNGTREIIHMKAFTVALESLGKTRFDRQHSPDSQAWWTNYFNDFHGVGDEGESDARGPDEGGDGKL